MGFWSRHRTRQSGKYAKLAYQESLYHRPAPAYPPPPGPPPGPVSAPPQVIYQSGFTDGWNKGWRAGQDDLIDALKTGRVRWEDISR